MRSYGLVFGVICLVSLLSISVRAEDVSAMVLEAMDSTVDPCDDFYTYACGGWMRSNPLPADRSSYSRTFTVITDRNQDVLRTIANNPSTGIVYDFYQTCMNTAAIQSLGKTPLTSLLPLIENVVDNSTFITAVGQLHSIGVKALFTFEVDLDAKHPDTYIAQFIQGGLAMPDRSLYLDRDADSVAIRKMYGDHISRMFQLSGFSVSAAEQNAANVLSVETHIATASLPNDQLIDPFKTYNKLDISGLKQISPSIPWEQFMQAIGRANATQVNVQSPHYFAQLSNDVAPLPVGALKSYLQWFLIHATAPFLSQDFIDEDFRFFGQIIEGKKELPPRWKRCIDRLDKSLGDLTGKYFADEMFSTDARSAAATLIQYIEDAMTDDIQTLSWMDNNTRVGALDKMIKMSNLIGYPTNASTYEGMSLRKDQYYYNSLSSQLYNFANRVEKLETPVDRNEWLMTASTVNAYYEPTRNQMVFPAGILQPPFFDLSYPWAINYGGIGVVMGHEATHSLDSMGSAFNGDGKLEDWWEEDTALQFHNKVDCVINQYSSFEALPGLYVNGNLTQGENVADMGGVKLSMNAYLKHSGDKANDPSPVKGLTNLQLFFVAFGQSWCTNYSPEYLAVLVKTNPHSPHQFRVIGSMQNTPEFSQAFKCPVGSPMNPKQHCEVW